MNYQNNPFKPLSQMTKADFEAVGFMSGLEVHQQILTQRKLFCRCPAGIYNERVDARILRHMRPTLSEMGEYDPTALMEFKTKKEIIYLLNKETVCTYEMDDAPPFEIDSQAINIALEVALLLNLNMVNELHIARKQYLDGSIPTGFQRTTIFGVDGYIMVDGKKVGILQLGLEEDACRIVSDVGHTVTFRTDRMGMPLIETVTYPDFKTPFEVARGGNAIKELVRATGKVRIGHGAAREDVNVSVTGGTRIELKGVPSIKAIPALTYYEAMRQWNLLKIRQILNERGIKEESFKASSYDVTSALGKADFLPIKQALERGFAVGAVKLEGFSGILAERIMPGTNFARELSERVRVIACLHNMPNIIHSDSMEQEITNAIWERVKRTCRAGGDDAVVLVWGADEDVKTAMQEIIIRAKEATVGIPSETRQPRKDGTTGFERLLPGPKRMYPDTDLPPIPIADEAVETIRLNLPKKPWDKREEYAAMGLREGIINTLMRYPSFAKIFDSLSPRIRQNGLISAASSVINLLICMKRRGISLEPFSEEKLGMLIDALEKGIIKRGSLFYIMWETALHHGFPLEAAIERFKIAGDEEERLAEELKNLQSSPPVSLNKKPDARKRYLAGLLMKRLSGKIDYEKVAKAVELHLTEVSNAGR